MEHFLTLLKKQIANNPDQHVLTDFQGQADYTYRTMAEEMARVDILLHQLGIAEGDKVALCGRNSAAWGVAFFALMASRRIAVSILPDFTPEGIIDLAHHSEAKALFCGDLVWKRINEESDLAGRILTIAPNLQAIISLIDWSPLLLADENLRDALPKAQQIYAERYPNGLCPEMIASWPSEIDEELCMINYTSGTTSSPKGVMISTHSLCSNVTNGFEHVSNSQGQNLVSILPMAHMYGLTTEFIFQVVGGVHIFYIQKNPTPTVLMSTFQAVHPYMLVCVPLVLEKIFKQKVLPIVKKPYMRLLIATPGIGNILKKKVVRTVCDALGGNIGNYMIGGAALNQEVEYWMHRLGMPYTVGYGMTECGPLIAFENWDRFLPGSCGKAIERMQVRIDSEDPQHIAGEIQTKGENLMMGYYKNDEATRNAFTQDGWLRTGDLGIIDNQGNIFIKGRSKSLILGPSGQNIYPEEIEDKINSLPGVAESLIVERDGHLVALIYADPLFTRRLGKERHEALINNRLKQVNHHLPAYSQIKQFEFVEREFEKTPKRSIKRFLYK